MRASNTLLAARGRLQLLPLLAHSPLAKRSFHASQRVLEIKPFLLADIGEGIRECEVIQWFVEPGARVEQFDKLCEVQSDKASVEISSRYDGVIKKLHYNAGEMALVGKPLVDIDVFGEGEGDAAEAEAPEVSAPEAEEKVPTSKDTPPPINIKDAPAPSKHRSLATPAVRRLCMEHGLNVENITGTGKDGRVMKEDVIRHATEAVGASAPTSAASRASIPLFQAREHAEAAPAAPISPPSFSTSVKQEETVVPLSMIQNQMFKTMTRSLTIPHFLYADEVVFNSLDVLRSNLNKSLTSEVPEGSGINKLTYMPFIIKSVSLALDEFPILNSRVEANGTEKPALVNRSQHNIGVAMDTPMGLLVPNIKNVRVLSVLEIASELQRLQKAASVGKLSPGDLAGGTITVSNIGNIGGGVVAPVIVPTEVAILGIGRAKTVPRYNTKGDIHPESVVNFCWSADHRVVDGATMARMGARVKNFLERPELLLAKLR
ncbi:hypothetical protein EX30DRAFT_355575 [Ascodesmis nigricans]|uniref:Dihydrolipoamide acetyltransferase component of pyruvate dehydrogenase complex n=1 Tax=Ascodesmis nigricans TaxID=341454 RepID=A0A4S2MT97_9PEZI|nr:hypothetical protein EX30DRAFT_355575 [Ascodesmis nigricans]